MGLMELLRRFAGAGKGIWVPGILAFLALILLFFSGLDLFLVAAAVLLYAAWLANALAVSAKESRCRARHEQLRSRLDKLTQLAGRLSSSEELEAAAREIDESLNVIARSTKASIASLDRLLQASPVHGAKSAGTANAGRWVDPALVFSVERELDYLLARMVQCRRLMEEPDDSQTGQSARNQTVQLGDVRD